MASVLERLEAFAAERRKEREDRNAGQGIGGATPATAPAVAAAPAEKPGSGGTGSPMLDDLASVAKTVGGTTATMFGMGGAMALDASNKASKYIFGGPGSGYIDHVVDRNIEAYKKAHGWGVSADPKPKAAGNPPSPVAEAKKKAAVAGQFEEGKPAASAENPMDKYGSVYEAAAAMTDKGFKRFVDKYGGQIPGLGYAEDAKTGKISRIIDNPELRSAGSMTVAEAHIAAGLKGSNESRGIEREKLAFEIDKFAKTNDMKDPQTILKLAAVLGGSVKQDEYDEKTGAKTTKEVPNVANGLKMLRELGYKGLPNLQAPKEKKKAPLPKIGEIVDGMKFKGGRPADPTNWEKI